jgi:hypothetical protein
VREESHLEEMRAAIKGDRERAARRSPLVPTPVAAPEAMPARGGVVERLLRFLRGR